MIPKVIPKRGDGKSSFQQLGDYITEGIEQSGGCPGRTSWDHLTQYIVKPAVPDALGDDVEKTIAVEVGNCHSLARAPKEMRATAERSLRAEDPVLHLVLSWPEHERPGAEPIFGAARHVLGRLGLLEHQYICAIHDNTGNRHCHIEVNRAHPRTFRPARLEWLHRTLHRAAREAEMENGWTHDKGLFEVVEIDGHKVIAEGAARDRQQERSSQGARRAEAWSGEMSLETWCKGAPAQALRAAVASATRWQHVHQALAEFSLELRDSGGGGMRVHDTSAAESLLGKAITISASKAFRFLKRAELEQRLGAFEAARPSEWQTSEPAAKGYKRDPGKRLERRLERRELRDDLHARYKREMLDLREQRQVALEALRDEFAQDDVARSLARQAAYRAARAAIARDRSLSAQQKRHVYLMAKLSHAQLGAQLREQLRQERAHRRELLPALPSWRAWVEAQALAGDEAAISALRGMVYQDGREAKRDQVEDEVDVGSNAVGTIAPATLAITDPSIRPLKRLTWRVLSHGAVAYSLDQGRTAFIDAGTKLRFGENAVTDEELKLALLYATDKWHGTLRLTGGDRVFRERVARMAAEMNIRLLDRDLVHVQVAHLAAQHARVPQASAAPVAEQADRSNAAKLQTPPTHLEDMERALQNPLAPGGRSSDELLGRARRRSAPETVKELPSLFEVESRRPAAPVQAAAATPDSLALASEWILQQGGTQRTLNTEAGPYSGRIVHVTAGHAVQDLGRADFAIHRLVDLPRSVTVGESASIRYTGGRAALEVRPTRNTGHTR